ncbi:MAG TPA: hemerythrin domain-containing protein [Burkholderiales bacterium]|nr:hemerythrin domain-containing protein [Burkholderiales bacterium]
MMHAAIRLIRDEHRSISAVLRAANFVVDKAHSSGDTPDFELLRAMLYYLREFPERRHHPNEDRVLFAQIKARTREADGIIAELRQEHERGDEMLRVLEMALDRWREGARDGARQFSEVLSGYTRFHHAHMEKEETLVLPAAERALSSEDWHEIYSAFESNQDPMFGTDTANEFRDLFSRIIRLAPRPARTEKPRG